MLNKTLPRTIALSMDDFTSKYNIGRGAIWVRISQDKLPREVMLSMGVVNEAWFLRRWQFMNYVKESNQSLVYFLEEDFSLAEIARTIATRYGGNPTSLREFMDKGLFALQGEEVKIATKVHGNSWLVFKYFRQVNNKLKRRGSSIDDILNIRMQEI